MWSLPLTYRLKRGVQKKSNLMAAVEMLMKRLRKQEGE